MNFGNPYSMPIRVPVGFLLGFFANAIVAFEFCQQRLNLILAN